jgi:hypothetical protein
MGSSRELFSIVGTPIAAFAAIRKYGTIVIDGAKTVWAWLTDLGTKALSWGDSIAEGLWTGLKNAWKGLLTKIKGLVDLLPDTVKKALGIGSPAKAMFPIGKFSAQGIGVGFEREMPVVANDISNAIDSG